MSKLSRQAVIRELVSGREVGSQDELRRLLFRCGHRVTQATLSRDIHELGLVKTEKGYKLPQGELRALVLGVALVQARLLQVGNFLRAASGTADNAVRPAHSDHKLTAVFVIAEELDCFL